MISGRSEKKIREKWREEEKINKTLKARKRKTRGKVRNAKKGNEKEDGEP